MKELKVRDLMTHEQLETLDVDDDLDFADAIVKLERIRHLPVLEEGRLAGVVTCRDICRSKASSLRSSLSAEQEKRAYQRIRIAEVMTTEVVTIEPDQPATEAARLMREHRIGCLPVMENDRLVGIITESDFLDHFIRGSFAEQSGATRTVRAPRTGYLPT